MTDETTESSSSRDGASMNSSRPARSSSAVAVLVASPKTPTARHPQIRSHIVELPVDSRAARHGPQPHGISAPLGGNIPPVLRDPAWVGGRSDRDEGRGFCYNLVESLRAVQ